MELFFRRTRSIGIIVVATVFTLMMMYTVLHNQYQLVLYILTIACL
jgi:hypothetical protein